MDNVVITLVLLALWAFSGDPLSLNVPDDIPGSEPDDDVVFTPRKEKF